MSAAAGLRAVGRLVVFVLRRTFVDPVRAGRLVDTGWPAGLRAIVGVGLAAYVALLLLAVLSGPVRGRTRLVFTPPDQTLPAPALPVLCLALVLALSCLFTAGLHLAVPLRLAVTTVVVSNVLLPVEWSSPALIDWVTIGLAAGLVALLVVRWRSGFHWLEFVLSLALIGHAVVGHQAVRIRDLTAYGSGLPLSELTSVIETLFTLAVPAALLAGAAVIEILTAAVTWTATGIGRGTAARPGLRRWGAVLLALLVVGRTAQVVHGFSDRSTPATPLGLGLAATLAAVLVTACAGVSWLADRTTRGDPRRRPDPDDLMPVWQRLAPPVALVLAATVSLPSLLRIVLRGFGLGDLGRAIETVGGAAFVGVAAGTAAAAGLAVAAVLAWRGHRLAAVLVVAVSVMHAAATVFDALDVLVDSADIATAVSLAAVAVLVRLVLRRQLTAERRLALSGVLLLGIAYDYRDWFTEPLTQLLSLTGVSAALLVGYLWRALTDHGYTRGDSATFPQPGRVLLAVANALVGVTSAALVALLGGRSVFDLDPVEQLGASSLGFPVLLAVSVAGLALAARGRQVDPVVLDPEPLPSVR